MTSLVIVLFAALTLQLVFGVYVVRALRDVRARLPAPRPRQLPLGFPTVSLKGGAIEHVQTSPKLPFKGRRLIIPSDFAGSVSVEDLLVDGRSQFAARLAVSGRAFTEAGVGVDMDLDVAKPGSVVELVVRSIAHHDLTFNAVLLGERA